MTIPLIIPTKINVPHPRAGAVIRPRVVQILDDGLSRPAYLTLVSAPAGYGKTTLIVNWLHGLKQPAAWLSLETEDDDLSRFIVYLVCALQKIRPEIGKQALKLLEASSEDSLQANLIFAGLIQDLSSLLKPVILVLEDYHVISSEGIHKFVENLIEHGHSYIQLVITTRNDPPLPLPKWRTRDQLTEIRVPELRFTVIEATEFYARVLKLELTKPQINLLAERTEGWAAGLQLAGLSIRNRPNKTDAFIIEGDHREVANYLMSEVLMQLPEAQKEFLLQTSILNRLSASLCNSVTKRGDGQLMLESLEAGNLFILALDEKREWFRYHQLFAEFLRKRLTLELSANAVSEIHKRASRWFAENRFATEAIEHALAAEDYEYAACLIGSQSEQWMRRGEISTILKYLNRLPENRAWNDWGLCLWYSWSYALRGNLNPAEHWTNRLEALITPLIQEATLNENGPIPTELQNAYAQVLAIRSVIARQNREFAVSITLCEQALRLVPADSRYLQNIFSALLSSAVLEAGNFDQAETLLSSSRQRASYTRNHFIAFTLLLEEAALAVMRGQLQRAYELNEEALRLAQTESMERLTFLPQLRLGRINYFWNQLVQAKQHLLAAIEQADVVAYPNAVVRGYITLAWIQNAEGQYPPALQTLNDAERLALDQRALEAVEMVRGVRAQLQLSAGENEAVTRWARLSDWETFDSSERSGLILSDESFFPYCQSLIASDEPSRMNRAEHLLAWRLADSEQQRRESTILKIYLMQALLNHAQNHPDLAVDSLLQALEIAMPENCIRPFLDEGRLLIPFLRRLPREHRVYEFAQKILSFSLPVRKPLQNMKSFSQQELKILVLMAEGHTNPEIAHKLILAVSTVRWYAKQIFRKLGVHNRTQAAAQAKKLNLI